MDVLVSSTKGSPKDGGTSRSMSDLPLGSRIDSVPPGGTAGGPYRQGAQTLPRPAERPGQVERLPRPPVQAAADVRPHLVAGDADQGVSPGVGVLEVFDERLLRLQEPAALVHGVGG